ncbi:hypothetical protein Peur_023106 [Populus x canadensis]
MGLLLPLLLHLFVQKMTVVLLNVKSARRICQWLYKFPRPGDLRKEYKEGNPHSKDVKKINETVDLGKEYSNANAAFDEIQVAREGGKRWKSMTDEENKPYVDKAVELKAGYAENKDVSSEYLLNLLI